MKFLHLGLLSIILGDSWLFGMERTQDKIDRFYGDHVRTTESKTYPKEMIVEAAESLR